MRWLLVVYDNDALFHWFPAGAAYIAAVLENMGIEVDVWSQDLHHWPDERLTDYLNTHPYDVVGIGAVAGYYTHRKLLGLAEAVNASQYRPTFILGGHGVSAEPAYYLRKTGADIGVLGEGEATVAEVANALADGKSLGGIRGIAYREGNSVTVNPRRAVIADVDSIPWPAYHLFPMWYYRLLREVHCKPSDFVMPVLSGRGCPFHCTFCYRIDEGFRPRSPESVVEEIRYLQTEWGITYIHFGDELLMSSVRRAGEMADALRPLKIHWGCNGRLNFAKPDVLWSMENAGCVFINYGIEALDDEVLRLMRKNLTVEQITQGIRETRAAGISPGFNIIFGNLGDTRQTLQKGVDFLLKYDDGGQFRTIRPVTPYPGCELYKRAIAEGKLAGPEDFYERAHVNSEFLSVNFTDLTDDEFHEALRDANVALVQNYYRKKGRLALEECRRLYDTRDVRFRGFRHKV